MTDTIVAEPGWGAQYLAAEGGELGPDAMTQFAAVQRTVNRYALAFDQRDLATLREVLTPDAEWAATVAGQSDFGPFVGLEAIMEYMTSAMSAQTDQRRHMLANPVLQSCANGSARLDAYLTLMSAADGRARILTTGFYSFWLRLAGSEWRIERLYLGLDTAE